MPTGIYRRSEEQKKQISRTLMGIKRPPFTKEHKEKLSKSLKGKYRCSEHSCWKGGFTMTDQGYILKKEINHPFANTIGYIREHRLIIEQQINRYLLPTEICHHINGIRNDNRIDNLMVFVSQSAHKKFEKGKEINQSEIVYDGRSK